MEISTFPAPGQGLSPLRLSSDTADCIIKFQAPLSIHALQGTEARPRALKRHVPCKNKESNKARKTTKERKDKQKKNGSSAIPRATQTVGSSDPLKDIPLKNHCIVPRHQHTVQGRATGNVGRPSRKPPFRRLGPGDRTIRPAFPA